MGYKFNSQYEGTCKKNSEHSWKAGEEICYDKEKKIICTIEACYLEQGGSKIEAKTNQFKGRKRLTAEEAHGVSKQLWAFALDDASEIFTDDKTTLLLVAREFHKGMIELMK